MINYRILATFNLVHLGSGENEIEFASNNGNLMSFELKPDGTVVRKNEGLKEKKERKISRKLIFLYCIYAALQNFFRVSINDIPLNGLPFMVAMAIGLHFHVPPYVTRQTHGAEHMLVTSLARLGHTPNLEEIKKFGKRTSRFCGTNYGGHLLTVLLILAISTFCTTFEVRTIVSCTTILSWLLFLKRNPGIWSPWQLLTVSKPTDAQLTLAIKGLECWVEENP